MRKKKGLKTAAVIVAAGKSTRMQNQNKIFAQLLGKPVLAYTLEAFQKAALVDEIYVVTREEYILLASDIVKAFGVTKAVSILQGGNTRQQSVKNGIEAAKDANIIAIHDGARPCVLPYYIDLAIETAMSKGAAVLGSPVVDTLKLANEDFLIQKTLDRTNLWHIQTPQIFKRDIIEGAHQKAERCGFEATDDCALAERCGFDVQIVPSPATNIKITTPEDLAIAQYIIESNL